MDDILKKLTQIEASAPKAPAKKKKLTEDTSKRELAKKPTLKDVFNALSENIAPGATPLPVMDPTNKKAGMGFVTSTNPSVQNILKGLDPKDVQIVQAPGTPGQTAPAPGNTIKPVGAVGATQGGHGQAMGAGQQAVQEKDEGKPGKNFAKIAKSAGKRYGSKEAGERVAGAVRAKLAKQGKLEEEQLDEISKGKAMQALQYAASDPDDERGYTMQQKIGKKWPEMKKHAADAAYTSVYGRSDRDTFQDPDKLAARAKTSYRMNKGGTANKQDLKARFRKEVDEGAKEWHDEMEQWALSKGQKNKGVKPALQRAADRDNDWALSHRKSDTVKEGAKVDRMVKHIEKSEKKLGKSKGEAEDIAWATANKRGMLNNKNKKVKEADIPSSAGIDNKGAGLGAGRSPTTLEGKTMNKKAKPDFLDMDKDGNKKEPMKKAVADKKKKAVKEGVNGRISAARHEGRADGLRGNLNRFKQYDDLEEARAYHDGYKDGLDECYGQGVYEGLAGTAGGAIAGGMLGGPLGAVAGGMLGSELSKESAPATPAATVPGMADEEMLGELSPQTLQRAAGAARARGRWAASVDRQVGSTAHKNLAAKDMALAKKADAKAGVTDPTSPNPSYDWANKGGYGMDNDPALKPKYQSGMADAAMDEGNAFTAALAKTPKGGKFSVGGKTFTDRSNYGENVSEYAFESWGNQLNDLLKEGLSVSVSKGNNDSEDSVNINATGPESEQLMAIVKSAGLGLFGDDHADAHSSAMSIQPVDAGDPEANIDVVDGSDGMLSLIKKLGGISDSGQGDEDYADEEGDEEHLYGNHETADKKDCGCDGDCECSDYDQPSNEASCNECGTYEGMHEAGCSMGRGKEMVDEVESEDQQEFEVAEANAPDTGADNTNADVAGQVGADKALAIADAGQDEEDGMSDQAVQESDDEEDDLEESFTFESIYKKLAFLESTEKEDEKAEKAGKKVAKDIEYDEDHKGKDDDKAEKAGKKVTKDIEYDDKKDKKEKVDEWANNAGPGKTVSDTTFEQDIDFMTKVISGGLNKQKSTGQTTIPVIAGQDTRTHNNPQDWATLAGIKKS